MDCLACNRSGLAWRLWRAHNFTGTLAEKIDGDFRAMRFELVNELGNAIGHTVAEGGGHRFETQLPAKKKGGR